MTARLWEAVLIFACEWKSVICNCMLNVMSNLNPPCHLTKKKVTLNNQINSNEKKLLSYMVIYGSSFISAVEKDTNVEFFFFKKKKTSVEMYELFQENTQYCFLFVKINFTTSSCIQTKGLGSSFWKGQNSSADRFPNISSHHTDASRKFDSKTFLLLMLVLCAFL